MAAQSANTNGLTWPSFADGKKVIANQWNIMSWPSTVVLDKNGAIRFYDIDNRPYEEMVETISKLIAEPPHDK